MVAASRGSRNVLLVEAAVRGCVRLSPLEKTYACNVVRRQLVRAQGLAESSGRVEPSGCLKILEWYPLVAARGIEGKDVGMRK